ncbi:MAG TPA: heparan-alpha-glucosaminide N-acetyltransferase domain-containing protein [Vicinamibacterales bacterium]|nr:heparan-alpha-glucosaminide N-acetyltransferase domain-containing protein [Vicinamibacterales bacterium]
MRPRVDSIDLVRGGVMVIMALDHVRDYFHGPSQLFAPEDLARTDGFLFATRWITHFCAPVFMFLAGTSAYLYARRGRAPSEVSRFLWTRGLWLVVLELTVVASFGWEFGINTHLGLAVIWALGWSMVVLASAIHLPWRILLVSSVAMIAAHNALDGVRPEQFGSLAWVWRLLHVRSVLLPGSGVDVRVGYPLIPWIGLMAAGFCFGRVLDLDPGKRRRLLLQLGTGLTLLFVVLRWSNLYGDPSPWSAQPTAVLTVVSFLNCTKYPPSLLYLLMTLGPTILVLGLLENVRVGARNPFLVFGRVPLFYYLLHLPLLHAVALVFAQIRYGRMAFLLDMPPSLRGPRPDFPVDYGYGLWQTYVIWAVIVLALYPVCRWYADVKRRSTAPILSYL